MVVHQLRIFVLRSGLSRYRMMHGILENQPVREHRKLHIYLITLIYGGRSLRLVVLKLRAWFKADDVLSNGSSSLSVVSLGVWNHPFQLYPSVISQLFLCLHAWCSLTGLYSIYIPWITHTECVSRRIRCGLPRIWRMFRLLFFSPPNHLWHRIFVSSEDNVVILVCNDSTLKLLIILSCRTGQRKKIGGFTYRGLIQVKAWNNRNMIRY